MAMVRDTVGHKRAQAFWRIVGLVYLLTIGWIVIGLALAAALVFMLVDVILQLVFNSNGLSAMNDRGASGFAIRLYRWAGDQVGYVLVGDPATFPILP